MKSTLVKIFLLVAILLPSTLFSQAKKVRKSPRAVTVQRVDTTDITITYHRPAVKGRSIWNSKIVPSGLGEDGKENKMPWRAGANENTTIHFSNDVKIDGKPLKAGLYGVHLLVFDKKATIIFSSKTDAWGSYGYNKKDDALRIDVKTVEAPHQEWLTFGFTPVNTKETTAFLHWEKRKFPFQITL